MSALQHGVEGLASGQEDFKAAMTTQVNLLSNQIHQMLTHLNQAPSASPVLAAADAPPAPAPHSQAIRLAPPEKFSGESRECKSFIVNCEMHYEQLPSAFPTERSKVAFMISHLTGRAKVWATTEWSRASPSCQSLARFTETLRRVFDPTTSGRETARELNTIRQGMDSVSDYAIRFRTLAADSGWNATALYDAFISGLSDPIQDLLVPLDLPEDLDAVIALAVRTDHRLKTRMQDRGLPSTNSRVVSPLPSPVQWRAVSSRDPEEPMQLGQARLSAEERRRRLQEGRCFYCGEQGHLVVGCPARRTTHQGKKSPLSNRFASSGSSSRSLMKIQVSHHDTTVSMGVLVDSGADESLMDWGFANQMGVRSAPLNQPLKASALDGSFIFNVTHVTEPVAIRIGDHHELVTFHLFHSAQHPLILGFPWLKKHNPHIDWCSGRIISWGGKRGGLDRVPGQEVEIGVIGDLVSASAPTHTHNLRDVTSVPSCYHDLEEVFSKSKATSLPPHRPYDCPIDLIPGAPIPKGRLYSISGPEKVAMTEYIEASLKAGLIRPSSSPAGAGFFFVGKKDGSLRPCIDYGPLNDITIKNRYPLPLMSSAFEQLQQARIFTKLDLRNAYHLVRIREGDEWKTGFNTPSGHYEYLVMPFGLTNAPAVFQALINDVLREFLNQFVFVYLDDILIFSPDRDTHVRHVRQVLQRLLENHLYVKAEKSEFHANVVSFLGFVIAPGKIQMDPAKVSAVAQWPTPDNRKKVQQFLGFANFYRRFIRNFSAIASPLHVLTSPQAPFLWSPQAEVAFTRLKEMFTTAPILTVPDPSRQFVVEVDASNDGVGAVLSQRSTEDHKLHPCAFLSRKLSPAERNYDVGNRELLAVKLALEEWRHWLEGAQHPFIVWTDHKNLEYIRKAKRLNSRQARWTLFFNRFNFVLSYRPGSQNTKPDALSRLFNPEPTAKKPEPMLPPHRVVGAVTWQIESEVKRSNGENPTPSGCPVNRLFVPATMRPQVIHWAHTSKLTCHPGIRRTIYAIRQRFWWPAMEREVREYVGACPVCARNKTSSQARTGLLQPLPVPSRPWAEISLDFVTGLPLSQGNTTVLTVVDRFSKMVHFIALPKLPSAKETAETMLNHVFRIHGFPRDVVSDRGPQFVSRFWTEFCKLIGATVSLTSGYHPEANGQAERLNQALETSLRCLVSQKPSSWSKHLTWVEFAHNTLPTAATGLTPFQCAFGYQPPLFLDTEKEVVVPSAHAMVRRCRRIWAAARSILLRSAARMKKVADRRRQPAPTYQPGQKVWLSTRDLPLHVASRKLAPRFVGPFPVSRVINPVSVRLRLPRSLRVHPTFHVGKLKPVRESPMVPGAATPPLPRMVDGGPVYPVKRLLGVRKRGRGHQYLVDWKGYGPEHRSWVRSSFIMDPALIRDFNNRKSPSGAVPKGGGTVMSRKRC